MINSSEKIAEKLRQNSPKDSEDWAKSIVNHLITATRKRKLLIKLDR